MTGRNVRAQLTLFGVRVAADVALERGQLDGVQMLRMVAVVNVHVNAQMLQQCEWFFADFALESWLSLTGQQYGRRLTGGGAALAQRRHLVHLEGGVKVLETYVAQPDHARIVQAGGAVHVADEVGVFVVVAKAVKVGRIVQLKNGFILKLINNI